MPAKSGPRRRKPRRSGQLLATSLGPPSGFAASTDEDDNGTPDETAYDDVVSESDRKADGVREADSRERPSSPPRLSAEDVAQLHAEIDLLQGRLATARFDHGGGNEAQRRLAWKHGSFRSLPSDTPPMDRPGSLLTLRRAVFDWLGAYSFVLRLSKQERKMLSDTELAFHRDNRAAFRETWTPSSLTHLHHDVYMELKRHLSRSILVAHIFTQVTTEYSECASRLWDALLTAFYPHLAHFLKLLVNFVQRLALVTHI